MNIIHVYMIFLHIFFTYNKHVHDTSINMKVYDGYMTVYDYIIKEGRRSVPLHYLKTNISVSVFLEL